MKNLLKLLSVAVALAVLMPTAANADTGRVPAATKAKKAKAGKHKKKAHKESKKAKKAKKGASKAKKAAHKSHKPESDPLNPAPKGNSTDYIPEPRNDALPPPNIDQNQ